MFGMNQIAKLQKYINASNNIVFFGGAGVSTESGVPDFRSEDGLYNQQDIRFDDYEPEYLLSHSCLVKHPKVFFEYYRQKMDVRHIEPNITHQVLAKLEDMGKLSAIITQNIDGLHQKAGSKNVYEVHGTTLNNYCYRCKKEYSSDYIFETTDKIPRCECSGIVRPGITLYEEELPKKVVDKALKEIRNADMLIIGGTSLSVYPAATFIRHFRGEHLVVINREKIDICLDPEKDLFICGLLGDVFKNLKM